MGRQSLYYCCQFLYFSSLYAWTLLFLKRARLVKPLYYCLIGSAALIATYLIDYAKYPTAKHLMWFTFTLMFGMGLGA